MIEDLAVDDTTSATDTLESIVVPALAGAQSGGLVARARLLMRNREVRRVVAFLFAGGVSALVTIGTTALVADLTQARFLWSALAGTELGILVNFSINDRLAFRDLAGHRRSFPVRLLRFHMTCALGQSIILLLSLGLHDLGHWPQVFAQALPIGVVTCINFAMHRFWTYRGRRVKVMQVSDQVG
jgi:putative flippase GtrA